MIVMKQLWRVVRHKVFFQSVVIVMIVMKQLRRVVREYDNNSEIIGMRYLSISILIVIDKYNERNETVATWNQFMTQVSQPIAGTQVLDPVCPWIN